MPVYPPPALAASFVTPGRHLTLPSNYRNGALVLRDDSAGRMRRALEELARRASGRKMILRLVESDFITVLTSRPLSPNQAGLWGPIFFYGEPVGATLSLDLDQILALDHDPSGIETLAHELRHQVDATRAFSNRGTYAAIYKAAISGDRTSTAQRYGQRVRLQNPDLDLASARAWLKPHIRIIRGWGRTKPRSTPLLTTARP